MKSCICVHLIKFQQFIKFFVVLSCNYPTPFRPPTKLATALKYNIPILGLGLYFKVVKNFESNCPGL